MPQDVHAPWRDIACIGSRPVHSPPKSVTQLRCVQSADSRLRCKVYGTAPIESLGRVALQSLTGCLLPSAYRLQHMPELPEVETMCRGLAPIVGSRVLLVERPECRRKPIAISPRIDHLSRRVVGSRIVSIERVGKRVVLWFSSDTAQNYPSRNGRAVASPLRGEHALVLEPRMTGLVLLAEPPTRDHLRLRIKLISAKSKQRELFFWDRRGLGRVTLLTADQFSERFETNALGPDALRLDAAALRECFRRTRRAIKVALLDQRAIAGVGNLYASEILHVAGVHPAARCDRLPRAVWERIHAALVLVLEEAIRYEGSTLGDGTYRNALNEAGGYQNHHRVYDRAGKPCLRCAGLVIRRIVQAQRSTFFCSGCQRKSRM